MADSAIDLPIQAAISRNEIDHAPARADHAGHVRHDGDIILDVLHHVGGEDAVELQRPQMLAPGGQVGDVEGLHLDFGSSRGNLPQLGQERLPHLGDQVVVATGEMVGQEPWSGAELHRATPEMRLQRIGDPPVICLRVFPHCADIAPHHFVGRGQIGEGLDHVGPSFTDFRGCHLH